MNEKEYTQAIGMIRPLLHTESSDHSVANSIMYFMCAFFLQDNPDFDMQKFLDSCKTSDQGRIMWKEPCKENLIECEGGSQMWVILNDKSENVLLLFNGEFQVKLSGEARQKLIDLLKQG